MLADRWLTLDQRRLLFYLHARGSRSRSLPLPAEGHSPLQQHGGDGDGAELRGTWCLAGNAAPAGSRPQQAAVATPIEGGRAWRQ